MIFEHELVDTATWRDSREDMKKPLQLVDPSDQEQRDSTADPSASTKETRDGLRNNDVHPDAHDERLTGKFPHERLDAYRVALEMAALAKEVAAAIPRGHRNIADHLERAADNTVLLMAEGANRRGAALKRQRFIESRGEAGEVAAAGDLVLVLSLHLGSTTKATKLKALAARVSMMLTRLIARSE